MLLVRDIFIDEEFSSMGILNSQGEIRKKTRSIIIYAIYVCKNPWRFL